MSNHEEETEHEHESAHDKRAEKKCLKAKRKES